jgi:hypothetical protein
MQMHPRIRNALMYMSSILLVTMLYAKPLNPTVLEERDAMHAAIAVNSIRTVDEDIELEALLDDYEFKDNDFYRKMREDAAQGAVHDNFVDDRYVLIINKTFQKGMILERVANNVFGTHDIFSRFYDFKKKSDNTASQECVVPEYATDRPAIRYIALSEFDVSTAKIPGAKERNGDGKTPEGLFHIGSIIDSRYDLFDGKRAYGPNFARIYHSIGLHGNGTDTTGIRDWRNKYYLAPGSLGVYKNNFSYGESHGCIRMNNDTLRKYVNNNVIRENMPVIIFEDRQLTNMLSKYYTAQRKIPEFVIARDICIYAH